MQALALLALGFSGLATVDVGASAPMGGIPTSNQVGAPLVPQVSSGPIFFIPIHKPSHFSFVTTVKDDGEGKGGGWQEAKANLPFGKVLPYGVDMWYCPIIIGVPIRNSKMGHISPTAAATMSAKVTNSAAGNTDFNLPQGIFCIKFRKNVETAFPAMYPDLGAKVRLG
jgi:hypothetical protein